MAPPPSTTPTSRSSSVHIDSQQQQQQGGSQSSQQQSAVTDTQVKGFAAIAASNVSGNEMPGYPLQPDPQSLHNSNGYPGYVEMGQQSTQNQWQLVPQQQQQQQQQHHHHHHHPQQTQIQQQQAVIDNNRQHLWSDASGKISNNANSNINWQEGTIQQQQNPSQQQQQNIQGNIKQQIEQQQNTQMPQPELSRPGSHTSWETGSVKESQEWADNIDNQQQQSQMNWSRQSPKLRDPQNSRLTPSNQQQPSQHQTWLQHSPKLSDHHNSAQQNARMTSSTQRNWQQNSPEIQGAQQNHRLTPSGQQMQQKQWPQQNKMEQDPRLTPSNQMSWPDTPTSQPNWSPNTIKNDNNQQPQQQWQDSQSSPRRTSTHQWQSQLTQENKVDNRMSWSPNSIPENQPSWRQQTTKQDMQNSGERIMWQQQASETNKLNGFSKKQDNSENNVYSQSNRVNLNSRLKSMILNKQQQQMQQQQQQIQQDQHHSIQHQMQHVNSNNGSGTESYTADDRMGDVHENNEKIQEKHAGHFINQSNIISTAQSNENLTGNFLSHSHHPRVDNLPDGGGLWEWTEGEHNHTNNNNDDNNKDNNDSTFPENEMAVFGNFMNITREKKNDSDQSRKKKNDQLPWKSLQNNLEDRSIDDKSFQQKLCVNKMEDISFVESQKTSGINETKSDNAHFLKTTNTITFPQIVDKCDPEYPVKQESTGSYDCTESSIRDTLNIIKNEEKPKAIPDYKFRGDGGPAKMSPGTGSWCCRRGGTEQPTPEHLKDGCCQGLQTKDEMLADSPQRIELKNEGPHSPQTSSISTATTTTKLQDHLDKLKKNVRTEVPDCNCFPADKCELLLRIPHNTNIERTH